MARLPRIDVAGMAQHVIQRGNNRQACFLDDRDRVVYLDALKIALRANNCALHAYVLMTNHVHLLMTPSETGQVARVMQSLGRRYVRFFNSAHMRTGTLWEGRYKSSLIGTERYVLVCHRYIELNPVRAGVVPSADAYGWSSYRCNAMGLADELLSRHPSYLALGDSGRARRRAYRDFFRHAISAKELQAIRDHANQGKVLGSRRFKTKIEKKLGRSVSYRNAGRPKNVL